MLVHKEDRTQQRIENLKRELDRLQKLPTPARPKYKEVKVRMRLRKSAREKKNNRRFTGGPTLNGGIRVSTRSGSIYTTILKILAEHGQLDRHGALFTEFKNDASPKAARKLLEQISVSRSFMQERARTDSEFLEHCEARTREYKYKAAKGIAKYQRILKNPKICVRGRWVGDFDEALNILSGGRSEYQVKHGKNVRILRRANLMFDIIKIDGQERCVLYLKKWHPTFKRACAMLASRAEGM